MCRSGSARRSQAQADLGEDLHRLIYLDLLEPKLAPVLLGGVRPGGLFVDVGANIGYWSLLAAARGSRVIAFEPGPPMVESFKENIALSPQIHTTCRSERPLP